MLLGNRLPGLLHLVPLSVMNFQITECHPAPAQTLALSTQGELPAVGRLAAQGWPGCSKPVAGALAAGGHGDVPGPALAPGTFSPQESLSRRTALRAGSAQAAVTLPVAAETVPSRPGGLASAHAPSGSPAAPSSGPAHPAPPGLQIVSSSHVLCCWAGAPGSWWARHRPPARCTWSVQDAGPHSAVAGVSHVAPKGRGSPRPMAGKRP